MLTALVFIRGERRECFPLFTSLFTRVCTGPVRGLHMEGNGKTLVAASREKGAYLVKDVVLS